MNCLFIYITWTLLPIIKLPRLQPMKILILTLLCLLSLNLQGQGGQQLAEVVRVERPMTPVKKKTKKKLREEKKSKRQQARHHKKQKARKRFKTTWKEKQTNKKRAWNILLTLGIIALALIVFGSFIILGLAGAAALAGAVVLSTWGIILSIFTFIAGLIIVVTPILAPIFTILGLQKLKEEGRPEKEGFDWTYFWAVFCSVAIIITFIGFGISVVYLAGFLFGISLFVVTVGIWLLFLGSIAGFFINLERLRDRVDTNDSPKIRSGDNN